jgi:hypothetical protein
LLSGVYSIEGALWDALAVYDKSDSFLTFDYISDTFAELKGQKYKGILLLNSKWQCDER